MCYDIDKNITLVAAVILSFIQEVMKEINVPSTFTLNASSVKTVSVFDSFQHYC